MAEDKNITTSPGRNLIMYMGRRSVWPWIVGGLCFAGAAAALAYYFTRERVNISDYTISVDIVNPIVPRAGEAYINVSVTNNSTESVSPVLRFDMWPTGHSPVEGSPQAVGNIEPGATKNFSMSYSLPSNWGAGTELNAQLMLIGVESPAWNVVSGFTVQGDIDAGTVIIVPDGSSGGGDGDLVTAVNPLLVAGAGIPAQVTLLVKNNSSSDLNRTFRLDLKANNKLTWHEGGTKAVRLLSGQVTEVTLQCGVPTDWGSSNSPVAIKIMDIGETAIFYGDLGGSAEYRIFKIIPKSTLKAYSGESFIMSQVPADRLVTNGQSISFTLGFQHIGGAKNYKAGCYIKTESPYWITQSFSCPADESWTVRQVTVSGVFHSNLGSGRVIDELMAFMEANITPSVPARDEELLLANWDAALTVR